MPVLGLQVLVGVFFLCLGAYFAHRSRLALIEARSVTRQLRSVVMQLEVDQERNSGILKRLVGSVSALGRWTMPKKPEPENGLPDPTANPEAWRAAVRRMAANARKPSQGELQ
ncbi:MAG: hypothetical protein [Circular genetic element sp.]|nr:MAG: hypothetical protein [Circular genetic element sp.]